MPFDFDDFDLFETCEEYYDDANEFESRYAEDDYVDFFGFEDDDLDRLADEEELNLIFG